MRKKTRSTHPRGALSYPPLPGQRALLTFPKKTSRLFYLQYLPCNNKTAPGLWAK